MSATPSDTIAANLALFLEKWQVISDSYELTIKNLQHHIVRGCLSNIPPGMETNRNERFHQHMKSFFSRSRIGLLLAYALLSVIIMHTCNTSQLVAGKQMIRPITASLMRGMEATNLPTVGLIRKDRERQINPLDKTSISDPAHWEIDRSLRTLDYDVLLPIYSTSLDKLKINRLLQKGGLSRLTSVNCKPPPATFHFPYQFQTCWIRYQM